MDVETVARMFLHGIYAGEIGLRVDRGVYRCEKLKKCSGMEVLES